MLKTLSDIFSPLEKRGPDGQLLGAPIRTGVIDMGSNSVRMVVFDSATRSPAIFFNEKVLCGLGERLAEDNRLSPEGRRRARAALSRFKALSDRMSLRALIVVATAAIRDAEDGPEFVEEIERDIGLPVQVASGSDEARLAAQGVLLGDPEADGVAADMGGASMELVSLDHGVVGEGVTTPLGPLRLSGLVGKGKLDGLIDERLDAVLHERPEFFERPTLYALGGSWRAVVKAYFERENYPLRVLHGFTLPADLALETALWASKLSMPEMRDLAGVSERRAQVAPLAARVLARVLRKLKPQRMRLSAFGLREGALWEHMPEHLRREDPLLDAARALERVNARMPGFGQELWTWLAPVLGEIDEDDARLGRAACLISDVSWRTHPDYRAQASFELVTRNNYGGVDHSDRVFIGVALLHRYKGGRRATRDEPSTRLIEPHRLSLAESLGRGMRLGAALAAAAPGVLPRCALIRQDDRLTLKLPAREAGLMGEQLDKTLQSFADSLGLSKSETTTD